MGVNCLLVFYRCVFIGRGCEEDQGAYDLGRDLAVLDSTSQTRGCFDWGSMMPHRLLAMLESPMDLETHRLCDCRIILDEGSSARSLSVNFLSVHSIFSMIVHYFSLTVEWRISRFFSVPVIKILSYSLACPSTHARRMYPYVLLLVALLPTAVLAANTDSQQRWMDEINLYRCIHGLPPLVWDIDLAATALLLAEGLSATGEFLRTDPSRTTMAFGFGGFQCGDGYREFDQTCAVWFWYLQYLETLGEDGCGLTSLNRPDAEKTWTPRDIEDVRIMLSDQVELVGCASRGHYYVCQFDANCGVSQQACGNNVTKIEHCVDGACFWCRDNTRVSSCWKWNPYVELGRTATFPPIRDGPRMNVTTTSEMIPHIVRSRLIG